MEEKTWSYDIADIFKEGVCTNTGKKNLKRILRAILNPSNVFDENSAKWLKVLIAGGLSPKDYFKKLHEYDSALVCGLIWNANFFAYRCRDCGISPCMSLCADCFLAGNHEGHDFNMFKSQAGGACDCGDETVLKKEGFCPNHGKRSTIRNIPDELVTLANIVIPKMVKCLYKKVKSQWINEANEGVLNTSSYLIKTLSELSKIEALRLIVSRQIMAIIKFDVLPNNKRGFSDFTPSKVESNRQIVKMSPDIKMPSSNVETSDSLYKQIQILDYQHGFRHSWLGVEDYKETYLHFFMEWLVELSFPNKLSTFLLQLLPIPEYKTFFTQLFCRQYTAIGKMLTSSLNPDQFSSRIVHVSVQLFSNESLAYKMVKEENLLTRIIFVLDIMIGQCLDYLPVEFEGITKSILLVDCGNKILKEHCYWPIASDLTNILSHLSIAKVFLESNDCLNKWFHFVKMLVGMNINKRRFLVHAEFESKAYYSAFSIEFECVASVMWELYRAINKLNNMAYVKCMIEAAIFSLESCSLVNKLKKTSFTFHLTVHRHLALFLHQAVEEYNDTSVLSSIDHIKSITMSYLINLLVSVEEIRAGLWRFNGHQITCQAQSYMQSCFCNSMLDLDIFLLQVLVTRSNVDDFIEMLVDRLSIRQWLHFTEKNDQDNTDENCLLLVQGFLNIVHMLLFHRVYSGLSEDEILRKDMIANLCVGDRTHSQLTEIVALRPANSHCSYKNFDLLLSEVAEYKAPAAEMSGLQQGVYVPKDEVWENEYDYGHIYLRVFKKSDQQNSLERYNKVMSKKYNSSASCYWPPLKAFPKIHSAYEDLRKLFTSKKLQQILIFISYQIQHSINTMPEMMLISTVQLLQIFAENSYELEDCVSHLDDDDLMIDLVVEYVDCYHDKQKLFFVSEKLKRKVLESNKKRVWEEEMYRNVHEDFIFDMFLIYKCELILPLTDYLETLIKKTTHTSTLLHLRTLLSQLSYKKFTLLKRFIQYFFYYCKTNDIEITELPFMVEMDSVTTQVIALLFEHFKFLFQIGKPLKNFPIESYGIELPHSFLCDNAHVTLNNTFNNDLNMEEDIDYIRKNLNLWALKQISLDQFEPITKGLDDQPMDDQPMEPMDLEPTNVSKEISVNLSLLTMLIKLHGVLSIHSKSVNKCDVAGDGTFYVGKLLKTFYNQSKLNESLKIIYPNIFTSNGDTIDAKNQVEDAKLERRKKVNQRQEEMLKEFASKQKRFLDNTLGISSNELGVQLVNNHNIYECVICFQSTESTEKRPIGLVVLLQPSTVLSNRVSQTSELNEMYEFRETCGHLVQQRETELSKFLGFQLALETGSDVGINVQACGHFVHIDCHQAYFQTLQDDNQLINTTKGEFLCPLCRGFSNEVLPILPDSIKEVHNMELEGAIKLFKEQVGEIKNLMEMPKFSSLRKRAFDVSVLTASTSLFYNSLEESTKLHMVGKQYHGNKFAVLIATLRHNLEETMMNTVSFKELSEQRKKSLLALFEFGNFNAQSLSTPICSFWIKLTCGAMKKNDACCVDIPFLLMDPVSLLIQFVITWPYRINADQLHCVVQSLYNLAYVQALLSIGLKVKESEKESWYRNVKKSEEITLCTLVNLVWRCSSMLQVSETANNSEEITLSVMSPHSIEYHIEQLCLPFLKKASFFMSIWLSQNELEMESKSSFVSHASLLKLGGCYVNYSEEDLSTLILKWSLTESAINVISSWCEELIEHLMKKKINYKKILPISNEWKMPSLIKLPLLFDSLFQEYRKQKCGKCKKIPEDPTLCLVCGKLLCFRSSCCIYKETVYECVQHSSDCGYGTGLFLVISSSVTLIIRDERICLWGSVYLDSFGEEDRDLKRGKPLFLNKERYAKLELEWRTHAFDKTSKHWRLHLNRL